MKLKKIKLWLCLLGILGATYPAEAQTTRGWGVGTFGGYSLPVLGMGSRFSGAEQFGATWHHLRSSRLMMEVEYHYSNFDNGEEAKQAFTWAVDGQTYLSPAAVSQIRFHSAVVNVVVAPWGEGFEGKMFRSYIALGAGIYGYRSERRNFIYPGQKNPPLDPTKHLNPQINEKAALGMNVGFGTQRFFSDKVALDLRARYHVVMGELHPMAAWGFDHQAFPLQFFQIGVGLKFYFQKS